MRAVISDGDVIQYVIDGQNRRIARKVNGRITNKWLYAGQLTPVAELDSADNVIARFSGGYMEKNDTVYQIITDHLGSPRLVVNVTTGQVVQRMDYDAFGNVIYDSNPGFQPFGFAGGLYDPETKLVRFGARDYDAETGRWTNKDPFLFGGGTSNLYVYSLNDPVNVVDEDGKLSEAGGDSEEALHALIEAAKKIKENKEMISSVSIPALSAALFEDHPELINEISNPSSKAYRDYAEYKAYADRGNWGLGTGAAIQAWNKFVKDLGLTDYSFPPKLGASCPRKK